MSKTVVADEQSLLVEEVIHRHAHSWLWNNLDLFDLVQFDLIW